MTNSTSSICQKAASGPAFLLALLGVIFSITAASAQSRESDYSKTKGWVIRAEFENNALTGCYAETRSPYAQAGFGSVFRMVLFNGGWYLATDFQASPSPDHVVSIDGRSYPANLKYDGSRWSIMQIGSATNQALGAGRQIVLNLEPEGPAFSLSGSSAAISEVSKCASGRGG